MRQLGVDPTTFGAALLSAFNLAAPAAGEAGTASAALSDYGAFIGGNGNPGNTNWPKGWLNILVFDKDYNLVDIAFQQLSSDYVQEVGSVTKAPHGLLSKQVTIKQPGFVYIYVSNEGSIAQEIYFDDLSITHVKSPVIQADDYYPFGLTFNQYQRENSVANSFKFNSKEEQDELSLGWLDYGARQYDPNIARWITADPLAEIMRRYSPYNYAFDNPIKFTDPDGMKPIAEENPDIDDPDPAHRAKAALDERVRRGGSPIIAGSAEGPPSTHTDADGNVVAVYNDGDLGVYKHDDLSEWDGQSILSTSGDGTTKMGETEYWDEFINPTTNQPQGYILYDDRPEASWNNIIESMHREAMKMDLSLVAGKSKLHGEFDLKNNRVWAPYGVMTGRLLNGKYATARSAGNFLAGYNGSEGTFQGKRISMAIYLKLAGALQTGNWNKVNAASVILYGKSFGPAPYYGEQPYSGRMIINGWNHGKR